VLIDGSPFTWFDEGGSRFSLLGAIDDATGEILALTFRPTEDLHGYTVLLREVIVHHGVPLALYGDRSGILVRNDRHWSLEEELAGRQTPPQFGQMLEELAIRFIAATSPQAKGRVERLWATLQDRLVTELRLRRITTLTTATAYLADFIRRHNRRWAIAPRETCSAFRAAPRDLEGILACRYSRVVARDNTVSIPGRWAQLPPGPHGRSWNRTAVEVRELLDGRLRVLHDRRGMLVEQPAPTAFVLECRGREREVRLRREKGATDPRPQLPAKSRRQPRGGIGRLTNIRRPTEKQKRWMRHNKPLASEL
jgi:hypothetical protein